MKYCLILLLFELCSTALLFSQGTLQEFVIEKDDNPQVFYKGCTPADRQDLFINSTLANIGSKLLWKLFREGMTNQRGAFLNMDTLKLNPVML